MYALIECNYETGFAIVGDAALSYRNYKVYIEGDNSFPDKVKRVGIGNVRFTRYGQELFDLLQSSRTVPLPRYGEDIFGFTTAPSRSQFQPVLQTLSCLHRRIVHQTTYYSTDCVVEYV